MPQARAIVHFTRDLRLDDQLALATAARLGECVPVLVIDPIHTARLRSSPRRAAYFCAAVAALDGQLRERGSHLIVRRGMAATTLRSLARAVGASAVVWSASYDAKGIRADRDTQSILEEAGLRVAIVHDAPGIPPEDVAEQHSRGDGYRAFAPFFARWRTLDPEPVAGETAFAPRDVLPSEPLPEPAEFGSQASLPPEVGEAAARHAFEGYLETEVLNYGVARNVPAAGTTAHLSAPLAFGTIGPRRVLRLVTERAADPFLLAEERTSIRLFRRSLAQRDFFLQLAYFHEAIDERPLQEKMRDFAFARTHPALDAWRAGRTGVPLVDAGMRELRETGWMHPRLRAVVASFLCFDLGVDWRVGRDEWERYLIEDAPALASGNWQWIAGIGADLVAYPRIYNPLRQARRFDPSATYIRRWIPELAALPDRAILERGSDELQTQLALPLFASDDYPARPVVDHETAARAFLERYAREVLTLEAAGRPSR